MSSLGSVVGLFISFDFFPSCLIQSEVPQKLVVVILRAFNISQNTFIKHFEFCR